TSDESSANAHPWAKQTQSAVLADCLWVWRYCVRKEQQFSKSIPSRVLYDSPPQSTHIRQENPLSRNLHKQNILGFFQKTEKQSSFK
ncbi:MAG: hypothetical protein PUF12_01595, partial [Thermoflexaceae bacterium]|nr:hypothetical protein [Thermoflexaceae bacterium]